MNKDFEKEYLEYSAKNTPDLWSRIEAGIDELESHKTDTVAESSTIIESDEGTAENNIVPITAKPKKNIKKYAGFIAAAACVVIAIPAIIFVAGNKGSSANMTASAPQSFAAEAPAMAATCDDAVCEEPAYEAETDAICQEVEEETETLNGSSLNEATTSAVDSETDSTKAAGADNTNGEAKRTYEDTAEIITADWGSEFNVHEINLDVAYFADIPWEQGVVLTPQEELTDFKLMKINITDVTDYGEVIYDSEDMYSEPSIGPDLPILLLIEFMGDLPEYAISFKDANGVECIMSISISGRDGSVELGWLN